MNNSAGPQAWIVTAMIVFGGFAVSGCDSITPSPAATTVTIPSPPATAQESSTLAPVPAIAPVSRTTPTVPTPTVNPPQ